MLVPFHVLLTLPATRQLLSHPDISNFTWMPLFLPRSFERRDEMGEAHRVRGQKELGNVAFNPSRKQGTIWHRLLQQYFSSSLVSDQLLNIPLSLCNLGSNADTPHEIPFPLSNERVAKIWMMSNDSWIWICMSWLFVVAATLKPSLSCTFIDVHQSNQRANSPEKGLLVQDIL